MKVKWPVIPSGVTFILAFAVIFVFPFGALGATYKTDWVDTPTGLCSIYSGKEKAGIGCFGRAVPATYTDGYIHLRKRGKARLAESGGLLAPIAPGAPMGKLRRGDSWKKRGITCRQRDGLKCWNRSGNGFRLTKNSFKLW